MKKLITMLALAFAATTATAAAKLDVKVTGSRHNGFQYWVKYTINGVEYRSDQAPEKINQIAWKHMSDDDKMTTVTSVYGIWDAREVQFGSVAFEMGKWYDEKMGYVEGANVLIERLLKKNHPDYYERFNNPRKYFNENVAPEGCEDLNRFPELSMLAAEQDVVFMWAVEAYQSLGHAEYRKTGVALKSTSADFIQLITDKVLVPNITPAGAGGYISQAISTALDYANNLSHAQDNLVNSIVGDRITPDIAMLIIDNSNESISLLKGIIQTCMHRAQALKGEIESKYAKYKAEDEAALDRVAKHNIKVFEKCGTEIDPNPDVWGTYVSLFNNKEELWLKYLEADKAYRNNPTDSNWERRTAADNAHVAAAGAFNSFCKTTTESCRSRAKAWVEHYAGAGFSSANGTIGGAIAPYVGKGQAMREARPILENEHASTVLFGSVASLPELSESDVSKLKSAAEKYIEDCKNYDEKQKALYDEAVAFVSAAMAEINPVIADSLGLKLEDYGGIPIDLGADVSGVIKALHAMIGYEVVAYKDNLTPFEVLCSNLNNCYMILSGYTAEEDPTYRGWEIRIENFVNWYNSAKQEKKKETQTIEEYVTKYQELVSRWEDASTNYGVYESTLPIYVTEQQIGGNNRMILNENSELGKALLLADKTKAASAAKNYRNKLNELKDQHDTLAHDVMSADFVLKLYKNHIPADLLGEVEAKAKPNSKSKKIRAKPLAKLAMSNSSESEHANIGKLAILWRDFNNRNEAHDTEMAIFADLCENENEYRTKILGEYAKIGEGWEGMVKKEMPDPYLRLAIQARGWGRHSTKWSNPSVLYMPGWYYGKYTYEYAYIQEAGYSNRGIGSYAYFAGDFYKTTFGNEPDPFDDFVEPKLNEIDAARAAAAGTDVFTVTFEPNGGGGGEMPPQMFVSGAPQTLNANIWEPPFPGETFLGWALTWDGDVIYTDRALVTIGENRTLYAIWSGSSGGGGSGGGGTVEPDDAPALFAAGKAEMPFEGNATYNGWVRNADGSIAGQLTVKAGKPAKPEKGGQSKLTITYTPFGGKKQTIKLANDAMPVAGGVATVAIPGVGTVKFTGDALVGVGVDVQAGKDMLKSRDRGEKAAATAAAASKAGVWTFALGTDAGYAAFSVTVDKKGKGKLAGTFPDGTKVSVSAQGVLGDGVLAIPFTYAKKGTLGFVFWVKGDGTAVLSDLTGDVGGSPGTARPTMVAPSASHRLSDGEHVFTAGDVSQAFTVAGKKWNVPKQNKRAEVDPNPTGLKLAFTEKTGVVKGTFTVVNGKAKTKYTVVGAVVGGKFYGSAYVRKAVPIPATAE